MNLILKTIIVIAALIGSITLSGQLIIPADISSISYSGNGGNVPYLTLDQNDNPVLCWTEKDAKSRKHYLAYATWNNNTNKFNNAINISKTLGMQEHKESMAKLAFKGDGTILAVFGVKAPTPQNRFAGYTAYVKSLDRGLTWSDPIKLVTDSTSQSQRFFDIERLPDGEIGITWLDARKLDPDKDGSTLYFAKTNKSGDFNGEKAIESSTCQCCRTDIFVDSKNTVRIAFRDIIQDSIRDMKQLWSIDNGEHFSPSTRISKDNWVINGCPHTGPSIADNNKHIAYAWYTMGGGEGVYFSKRINKTKNQERKLVNDKLYHPQLIGISDEAYLLVGDEEVHIGDIYYGKICLYKIDKHSHFTKYYLDKKISDNSHPVIKKLGKNKILIAWTKKIKKSYAINYTIIDVEDLE